MNNECYTWSLQMKRFTLTADQRTVGWCAGRNQSCRISRALVPTSSTLDDSGFSTCKVWRVIGQEMIKRIAFTEKLYVFSLIHPTYKCNFVLGAHSVFLSWVPRYILTGPTKEGNKNASRQKTTLWHAKMVGSPISSSNRNSTLHIARHCRHFVPTYSSHTLVFVANWCADQVRGVLQRA